jgi:lysophospholipid acyltransferase (LPLAT)-like uncharacterized protein
MALIHKKDRLKIFLASLLGWLIIQGLGRLTRIRQIGQNNYQELERRGENYILTLWHGRMLLPIFAQRNRGVVAMVSQYVDGEIIARTVQMMGYRTVRGSSTRGGTKALREMVKIMRSGVPGAMFPDGPKGPRGDFKIGTIILAQLTDAYIVPMTYSADPAWILKNWDQFMIAKPFARTVIAYGEPVKIPRSLDDEQMLSLKSHLEDRMNDLIAQADRYLKQDWK